MLYIFWIVEYIKFLIFSHSQFGARVSGEGPTGSYSISDPLG